MSTPSGSGFGGEGPVRAFGSSRAALALADASGRIAWANTAFLELHGVSAGTLDDVLLRDLVVSRPGAPPPLPEPLSKGFQGVVRHRRLDGSIFLADLSVDPVRGEPLDRGPGRHGREAVRGAARVPPRPPPDGPRVAGPGRALPGGARPPGPAPPRPLLRRRRPRPRDGAGRPPLLRARGAWGGRPGRPLGRRGPGPRDGGPGLPWPRRLGNRAHRRAARDRLRPRDLVARSAARRRPRRPRRLDVGRRRARRGRRRAPRDPRAAGGPGAPAGPRRGPEAGRPAREDGAHGRALRRGPGDRDASRRLRRLRQRGGAPPRGNDARRARRPAPLPRARSPRRTFPPRAPPRDAAGRGVRDGARPPGRPEARGPDGGAGRRPRRRDSSSSPSSTTSRPSSRPLGPTTSRASRTGAPPRTRSRASGSASAAARGPSPWPSGRRRTCGRPRPCRSS